jgi:hypothetical protein
LRDSAVSSQHACCHRPFERCHFLPNHAPSFVMPQGCCQGRSEGRRVTSVYVLLRVVHKPQATAPKLQRLSDHSTNHMPLLEKPEHIFTITFEARSVYQAQMAGRLHCGITNDALVQVLRRGFSLASLTKSSANLKASSALQCDLLGLMSRTPDQLSSHIQVED